MEIIEKTNQGVPYLAADAFGAAGGVAHGFSTRLGGVSEDIWSSLNLGTSCGDDPDRVRENHRRFFAAIGADGDKLALTNQVHGGEIRSVTSADWKTDVYDKPEYEADGLMTATPGVILRVAAADCLPILFYDPVRRVIAAVHAGWRGTASGIAGAAVERMCETYGSRPEDILAAIGPGISQCCFETYEDVPNAMMASLGSSALQQFEIKENGKFAVDLKGLNRVRLLAAGLTEEHIAVSGDCTACLPDKYWSHRKMGTARGSMAAAIQLL